MDRSDYGKKIYKTDKVIVVCFQRNAFLYNLNMTRISRDSKSTGKHSTTKLEGKS